MDKIRNLTIEKRSIDKLFEVLENVTLTEDMLPHKVNSLEIDFERLFLSYYPTGLWQWFPITDNRSRIWSDLHILIPITRYTGLLAEQCSKKRDMLLNKWITNVQINVREDQNVNSIKINLEENPSIPLIMNASNERLRRACSKSIADNWFTIIIE